VKTVNGTARLIILFAILSIFIVSGCAKKVSKVDMEGRAATEEMEPVTEEEFPAEEEIMGEEIEELVEEEVMEEEVVTPEAISDVVQEVGGLLPVYFDYDRYSLRKDTKEILQRNADWLSNKTSIKVRIEGHADERGSNEYNLALGDRRARSVMMYLSDLGVTAELSTVTYGEERPVCSESMEECWSKNRRAEFVILSE
jgi:peptidoglycan-associated lipoprotein